MTASEITGSDQRGETWTRLPAPFTKYEWSPDGFGPDQRPIRRAGAAAGLATTVSNHGGYLMVKPYDDDGVRQTKTVHSLVLLGAAGPCPPGMESRHLDDDPLNNRWAPGETREDVMAAGGNLMYGDKAANTRDKASNGRPAAVAKTHPCVNYARCGGMVVNQGRRCLPCAREVGRRAAAMLGRGVNLEDVTAALGYQTPEWVWKLARDHGGYTGTLAAARSQHPRWTHRVSVTVRSILRRGEAVTDRDRANLAFHGRYG